MAVGVEIVKGGSSGSISMNNSLCWVNSRFRTLYYNDKQYYVATPWGLWISTWQKCCLKKLKPQSTCLCFSCSSSRNAFSHHLISRLGDLQWPAQWTHTRSVGLCDFFLWGYLKHKVYSRKILSINDLMKVANVNKLLRKYCRTLKKDFSKLFARINANVMVFKKILNYYNEIE